MYVPNAFNLKDLTLQLEVIRRYPLATVNTHGSAGLIADHIPLVLSPSPPESGRYCLHGHVARVNPVWHSWQHEHEVLAVFHGPQCYITPSWYASKMRDHRVVPTWNFVTVHARGRARVIEDPGWLRDCLDRLTRHQESTRDQPWHLSDADENYTDQLLQAIVGVEIQVTELTGKAKLSQNQPRDNFASVYQGVADEMAGGGQDMLAWMDRVKDRVKDRG